MASLRECAEELTTCAICLDDLVDPKSLPCLHTFCLKCIRGHCRDNSPGDQVHCPVCRTKFVIPRPGVEQLKCNFLIHSLVEAKKISGGSKQPGQVLCDVCSKDSDVHPSKVPTATVYCNGCGWKLCARCSKTHGKIPGGAHQVVPFGTNIKEDLLKLQASFCTVHPGNKLEIHCITCHVNICVTCHAMKHKKHDCKDIIDICKTFSQALSRDVEQVAAKESSFLQKVRRLDLEEKKYVDGVDCIEKELRVTANELKRQIDEAVNQMVAKLADTRLAASKVTNAKKSDIEFAIAASQSFTRYSRELLDNGKPNDVTQAFQDLHERANELLKRDVETDACGLPEVEVSVNHLYDAMREILMDKPKHKVAGEAVRDPPTTNQAPPVRRVTTELRPDNSSSGATKFVRTSGREQQTKRTNAKATAVLDNSSSGATKFVRTSGREQQTKRTNAKATADNSSSGATKFVRTSGREQQTKRTNAKATADASAGTVIAGVSTTSQIQRYQQLTSKPVAVSHVISSDERGAVAGVAIYSDKLFVLRVESEERIEQFDVKTFQQEKFIKVNGLRDDVIGWRCDRWYKSMTSCDINSCLYISDRYEVFRVNPSTKNVISWPVDGYPHGLSVNETRNVLVTCIVDNTIKEYSTDGSFVRSIKLQVNHVEYPLHCIQLTDSRYVVCHVSPVDGVSEIDKHGTLIATYRNSETTKLEIYWPRCVILFNDSLLVANMSHDRILLLNTSLSDARPLSLPVNSQLSLPRCMYLEQSRGRLFVGEESGRVLVIDNIDLK